MDKKDKDNRLDDFKKLKDEIIVDQVNEIFRTRPKNHVSALEEIGFEYYEEDDYEEIEEKNAKPENQNQRELVAYLEGKQDPSEAILRTFFAEKDSERPNLPLIRRYFRGANQKLKALILYGLDHYPVRIDLLSDLAYFHEFGNILGLVISHYTQACLNETNLQVFTELAQEFYYATSPDGYEALIALRELFEPHTEKRKIIDFLISEEAEAEKSAEPIEF
jgi:hypothetical protein